MELEFDSPKAGRDLFTPGSSSWEDWLDGLERRPDYLAVYSGPEVCGHAEAPVRLGGYFVEPLESVVSLRPFDDAREGVLELEGLEQPVPYVLFEVEKIVRMMIHQSALAFEILSTPYWLETADGSAPCRSARQIAELGVGSGLVEAYRDRAAARLDGPLDDDQLPAVARQVATCAALGDGVVSLDLERLRARFDGESDEDLRAWAERLVEGFDSVARDLPDGPANYDALDEWLIATRTS